MQPMHFRGPLTRAVKDCFCKHCSGKEKNNAVIQAPFPPPLIFFPLSLSYFFPLVLQYSQLLYINTYLYAYKLFTFPNHLNSCASFLQGQQMAVHHICTESVCLAFISKMRIWPNSWNSALKQVPEHEMSHWGFHLPFNVVCRAKGKPGQSVR